MRWSLAIVNGEDAKGKTGRPMGNDRGQGQDRPVAGNRLVMCLQEGVPVGIGAKPVGPWCLDIDPKDKKPRQPGGIMARGVVTDFRGR